MNQVINHKRLNSLVRVRNPNVCSFMEHLEHTMKNYDLEFQRSKNGLDTRNYQKKENLEKRKSEMRLRLNKKVTIILRWNI